MIKSFTPKPLYIYLILLLFSFILNSCGKKEDNRVNRYSLSIPSGKLPADSKFGKFLIKLYEAPPEQRAILVNEFLETNPYSPVIEDSTISFFYFYGKASKVLINGDIQSGWSGPEEMNSVSCGDSNFFYIIYSLPNDSRVDYQYIVDDSTITDPKNPVITPTGYGYNSQCAMPLFKSKDIRQYRENISHGEIDSILFESKLTTFPARMVKIYKPFNYASLSDLPVLYVNDGYKAIQFSSFINILDNMINDEKINPVIVVFIDYSQNDDTYFLKNTNEYAIAICDELLPLIDSIYSTSQRPKDRMLSGISAGSHAALLTALKRPDVFLNASGQSTTVTEELLNYINDLQDDAGFSNSIRIYFDVGRFDLIKGAYKDYPFLYANQLLSKELKNKGIDHTFKVLNDGHQWANWRERTDEILHLFFGKS